MLSNPHPNEQLIRILTASAIACPQGAEHAVMPGSVTNSRLNFPASQVENICWGYNSKWVFKSAIFDAVFEFVKKRQTQCEF